MAEPAPYFSNHDRRSKFPWSLYHRELERRLAESLQGIAHEHPRTLVVGCGLEPFVPGVDGPVYHGADLDAESIRACQERYPEMASRLAPCPGAYELPSGGEFDAPFDVIIAKEVIEHVEDPERWVRGLARRLARGGQLMLTTPNYGSFSTLPLLEATVLELFARRDGYSRRHIHPSRFDRRRLSELSVGPDVSLIDVCGTRTGWALFGRWQRAA